MLTARNNKPRVDLVSWRKMVSAKCIHSGDPLLIATENRPLVRYCFQSRESLTGWCVGSVTRPIVLRQSPFFVAPRALTWIDTNS